MNIKHELNLLKHSTNEKIENQQGKKNKMVDIQSNLLEFISKNFMVEPEEVPLDRSLIDEGIIDSFGLVEISAFLEKQHHIKIREEDMIRENFGSILRIVAFVEKRVVK